MDIDHLTVGKCYTLQSTGEILGKLTAEPRIMGSGDGREMTAEFKYKEKSKQIPRWKNYNEGKRNLFIEVDCEQIGGRRKSRRKSRRNSLKKRRTTRHN